MEKTECSHDGSTAKFKMQFQLFDEVTYPVGGTQFWVTLKISKIGDNVLLSLPTLNFQTGPVDPASLVAPGPTGGTLRTVDGFLPEGLRPTDPVYHSYFGACSNGQSMPFSYSESPFPSPISGYIISITLAGAIIIQAAGQLGALIPPGGQVLMPTDLLYRAEKSEKLDVNFVLGPTASYVLKRHANDAFDGTLVWTWTTVTPNSSNPVNNVWARVGKIKDGKLKLKDPVQISDLPNIPNTSIFDTAVAINRTDKKNIVISYGVVDFSGTTILSGVTYRAVSFDGGKKWPQFGSALNGPTNIQAPGPNGFCECPGVQSDKYGNIWYLSTNYFDTQSPPSDVGRPLLWISTDKGVTFSFVYIAPDVINYTIDLYDNPAMCFGGDGSGQYGIWISSEYYYLSEGIIPFVAFIPVYGFGSYGTGSAVQNQILFSLANTSYLSNVAASEDGRLWIQSSSDNLQNAEPYVVQYKSPGPIDSNYAGPWQLTIDTLFTGSPYSATPTLSAPSLGYTNSYRTVAFDEKRQALYSIMAQQAPDYSQNMRLFLIISRNNGQTFSQPFYISDSDHNNRGLPTVALDTKTGDLSFGWYDGRKDKSGVALQYYGAILPSSKLDKMIKEIPPANPVFTIPNQGAPPDSSKRVLIKKTNSKVLEARRSLLRHLSP